MIIKSKRFWIISPIYVAYIVLILLFINVLDVEMLVQVFTDKVFVYLIIPPFILGIALIEESLKKTSIIRMDNRKQALFLALKQQYLLGFIYLVMWFALIALFAIKIGEMVKVSIFLGIFIRYLLCFVLIVNISACMKRLNYKIFVTIPFVLTYAILVIDILVLTFVTGRIGTTLYLVFSWTFFKNSFESIVVLIALSCLSYSCLRRLNSKADFY